MGNWSSNVDALTVLMQQSVVKLSFASDDLISSQATTLVTIHAMYTATKVKYTLISKPYVGV